MENVGVPHIESIYAQLDMLEKNLDKEIESLKEWGE
jgi:hypothetical protein